MEKKIIGALIQAASDCYNHPKSLRVRGLGIRLLRSACEIYSR